LIHEHCTKLLEKDKDTIHVYSEQPLIMYLPEDDIRISGRYDDYVITKKGNFLIEKKSTKSITYLKEPYQHHLYQVMIYMKCLNLDSALLVYFEKNTMKTKTFEIKFDKKILDDAIARARILDEAIKNKIPPIPEGKVIPGRSWECAYCPYKDMCDKIDSKENLLKKLVKAGVKKND
ncbi:MAG: CRISPR-associated protein Cas4, partial [Promethearchaeota archaeon]